MSGSDKIKVGDLVRLKDDKDLDVGVGLVLGEKEVGFTEIMKRYHVDNPEFIEDIEEFLLYKPIYLVLWQGEHIAPNDKPVWMFSTEITVLPK